MFVLSRLGIDDEELTRNGVEWIAYDKITDDVIYFSDKQLGEQVCKILNNIKGSERQGG